MMRIHFDFDHQVGDSVLWTSAGSGPSAGARGLCWQDGDVWRAMTNGRNAGRGEHVDRLRAVEAAIADAGLPAGLRGGDVSRVH